MKTLLRICCRTILVAFGAIAASPVLAAPLGTGFTYQGQLNQNGSPVNGTAHLRFSLWDAAGSGAPPVGGTQIGASQIMANVPVTNGLFTVQLNGGDQFGVAAFNGDARWLQVEVCSDLSCSGSPTVLAPRQPVTAAPYSRFAAGPWKLNGSDLSFTNGKVGIGTSTPHTMLELQSGFDTEVLRFGHTSSDYHYLSTSFHGAQGPLNYLGFNIERGSNDIRRVMTLQGDGNVGIGTASPSQALQVVGNIFLGPSGQYSAPAAEETVRILRGSVRSDGLPTAGCCYSVTRVSPGVYDITYNTPFTAVPSVTVTSRCTGFTVGLAGFGPGSTPTASMIRVLLNYSGSSTDCDFYFMAIGPR